MFFVISILVAILAGIIFGHIRYDDNFCLIRNVLFGAFGAFAMNYVASYLGLVQIGFAGTLFVSILGSLIALAVTDVFRLW